MIVTARNPPGITGNAFHFIAANVSTAAGTQKVINEIRNLFDGVDILINNAGGSETPGGGFQVLTDEHWETTINTNLMASVRLDKGLLPYMLQKKIGCDHSYRFYSAKTAFI